MSNDLVVLDTPAQGGEVIIAPSGGDVSHSMPGPAAVAAAKQGVSREAPSADTAISTWTDAQHVGHFGQLLADCGLRDSAVTRRVLAVAQQVAGAGGSRVHALGKVVEALATGGENAATIRAVVEAGAQYVEHRLAAELGETAPEEGEDEDHRHETEGAMKREWGFEYAANIALVNRYLDGLPPAVQITFENARLDDGSKVLNSPAVLRWLAEQARGPAVRSANASSAAEKTELEELMRQPGSRYWKGPDAAKLQARYRDIATAAPAGDRPLPGGSAAEREIADIEALMRTNRSRYNRDERMQARYRELLQSGGG